MSDVHPTVLTEAEKAHLAHKNPRKGHTLPSHAEYVRTLGIASYQGVLSTIDRKTGVPYGSIVELVPLEDGSFVFFISTMASHTRNLMQDPRCSLLIADGLGEGHALSMSRATFMGKATQSEDGQQYREQYLKTHPHASMWIDFKDFYFYRLEVERIRYIGGFGRMSWIRSEAYTNAAPDPLWSDAEGILRHMNEDHKQNMLDFAEAFTEIRGINEIQMTLVDRFGFEMTAYLDNNEKTIRLSFSSEVKDVREVRKEMVALANEARSRLGKTKQTSNKASSVSTPA